MLFGRRGGEKPCEGMSSTRRLVRCTFIPVTVYRSHQADQSMSRGCTRKERGGTEECDRPRRSASRPQMDQMRSRKGLSLSGDGLAALWSEAVRRRGLSRGQRKVRKASPKSFKPGDSSLSCSTDTVGTASTMPLCWALRGGFSVQMRSSITGSPVLPASPTAARRTRAVVAGLWLLNAADRFDLARVVLNSLRCAVSLAKLGGVACHYIRCQLVLLSSRPQECARRHQQFQVLGMGSGAVGERRLQCSVALD